TESEGDLGGREMARVRGRLLVLAVAAASGFSLAPAGAQRSPLEDPDPVSTVRVHLDGSVMLAQAENQGIDFSGAAERVPSGIEADAVVTDADIAKLKALGATLVAPGEHAFAWSAKKGASAATLLAPPAPTVRIVRADYFTTKGQGFLYVE